MKNTIMKQAEKKGYGVIKILNDEPIVIAYEQSKITDPFDEKKSCSAIIKNVDKKKYYVNTYDPTTIISKIRRANII